jgi:putative lipoprotein
VRVCLAAVVIALSMMVSGNARADELSPDPDPWFGPDKALHFGAAFGISVAGYAGGVAAFDDRWSAVAFGSGIAIGLGAAKEGLDAAGLGQPSWKDFAWDVIGAALGIGVAVSFDAALRGPEP